MKNSPLLTICVPSLRCRFDKLTKLYDKLNEQSLQYEKDVELVLLIDNKNMSVGKKRKQLFNISNGLYVCQIDDDDDIVEDFVKTLIDTIKGVILATENMEIPEVISYDKLCNIDGRTLKVVSSIKYPTDDSQQTNNTMYRYPWHWCCWRNDIAKSGKFYNCNGIEDSIFPKSLRPIVTKELKLNKILCYYNFNSTMTQSPQFKISDEDISQLEVL